MLASHEVHSWCCRLDVPSATLHDLYATLSDAERCRSARFRFERDRQRFIVAHGVLRELLGRYLGVEPGRLTFVCNPWGKPELSPEFGGRVRFNLSHSADVALIAVALDSDVGVDLEYVRAEPDHAEIARQVFSGAEVAELDRVPRHLYAEAFLKRWTELEAYGKARGVGLAMHHLHDGWSLYPLEPAPGYVATLVVEGSGWRLRQFSPSRDMPAGLARLGQEGVRRGRLHGFRKEVALPQLAPERD